MYKRLANAESHEALDALAEEIADRFGALPEPAEAFLRVMALRPALKRLAIESLKANEGTAVLRFHPDSPVDRDRLIGLAKAAPEKFGLRPGGVFTLKLDAEDWESMARRLEGFLQDLATGTAGRSSAGEAGRAGGT